MQIGIRPSGLDTPPAYIPTAGTAKTTGAFTLTNTYATLPGATATVTIPANGHLLVWASLYWYLGGATEQLIAAIKANGSTLQPAPIVRVAGPERANVTIASGLPVAAGSVSLTIEVKRWAGTATDNSIDSAALSWLYIPE